MLHGCRRMEWSGNALLIDSVDCYSLKIVQSLVEHNSFVFISLDRPLVSFKTKVCTVESLEKVEKIIDSCSDATVFDSLSILIELFPLNEVLRIVKKGMEKRILWIIHSDLHDEMVMRQLEYVFPCRFEVIEDDQMRLFRKKKIPEVMQVQWNSGILFLLPQEAKVVKKQEEEQPVSSFNLGMTEEQREAKNNLSLPYYEAQKSKLLANFKR